jgi:hypothetical protein
VSDDKDDFDASDWLSGQFDPTAQIPKQPAPTPPSAQAPAQPVQPVFPVSAQPVFPPTPPPPTPAAAPPLAPAPNAEGGFNWGLRPGGAAEPPQAAQPPAQARVQPVAPPPAQVLPPTQPYSPPPAQVLPPTQPYSPIPASPPPTEPFDAAATRPMSWEEFAATQALAAAQAPPAPQAPPAGLPSYEEPTQAYTVQPWDPFGSPTSPPQAPAAAVPIAPAAANPGAPTSAIDALFGETQFQEYEEAGVLQSIQAPATDGSVRPPREPRAPLGAQQKVLMGVAGGLVGVLILLGLFFLGTRIGTSAAAQPPAAPTGAPTSAPTSAGTGGPAAAGVQAWNVLQGRECIQPFSNAWAATFTIVPCTSDHTAEMVFKGTLPNPAGAPYPSSTDLQSEITPLCSSGSAINYAAAAPVTDMVLSYSYPATAANWNDGARTYYCFVNRQSGGNLPGDLAVPAK